VVLPVDDEPDPLVVGGVVERLVVEPESAVPDEDEPRLESGDADGDPPSLPVHAAVPTAITSAKNTGRALIISHLLASRTATVMPRAPVTSSRIDEPTRPMAGTRNARRRYDRG
jgi:hypothetical protein